MSHQLFHQIQRQYVHCNKMDRHMLRLCHRLEQHFSVVFHKSTRNINEVKIIKKFPNSPRKLGMPTIIKMTKNLMSFNRAIIIIICWKYADRKPL